MRRWVLCVLAALFLAAVAQAAKPMADPLGVQSPVMKPLDNNYDENDSEVALKKAQVQKTKSLIAEGSEPAANEEASNGSTDDDDEVAAATDDHAEEEEALSVASTKYVKDSDDDNDEDDEEEDDDDDDDDEDEEDVAKKNAARAKLQAALETMSTATAGEARKRKKAGKLNIAAANALAAAMAQRHKPEDWKTAVDAVKTVYNAKDDATAQRILSSLLRIRQARQRIIASRDSVDHEELDAEMFQNARQMAKKLGIKALNGDAFPFFRRLFRDLNTRVQKGQAALKKIKGNNRNPTGAIRKRIEAFENRLSTLETIEHFVGCIMNPKRKACNKNAALPPWVAEVLKQRIAQVRGKIKNERKDEIALKKQLATLKKKENVVKRKTVKRKQKLKVVKKRADRRIKRAAKQVKRMAKRAVKTVKRKMSSRKKWRKFRQGMRRVTETKFGSREGHGWQSYSNQAYDVIFNSALKPKTPIFAPGMSEGYNKQVGYYVYLLSFALPDAGGA